MTHAWRVTFTDWRLGVIALCTACGALAGVGTRGASFLLVDRAEKEGSRTLRRSACPGLCGGTCEGPCPGATP